MMDSYTFMQLSEAAPQSSTKSAKKHKGKKKRTKTVQVQAQGKPEVQKKEEPEFDVAAIAEHSVEIPKKYKDSGVMAFQTLTAAEQMAAALNQNDIGINYLVKLDEKLGLAIVVTNVGLESGVAVPNAIQYDVPKRDLKKAVYGFESRRLDKKEEYSAVLQKAEKRFGTILCAKSYEKKEGFVSEGKDKFLYLFFPAQPMLDREKQPITIGDELYHYKYGRCKVTELYYDDNWFGEVNPHMNVTFDDGDKHYTSISQGKNKDFKHRLWTKREQRQAYNIDHFDLGKVVQAFGLVAVVLGCMIGLIAVFVYGINSQTPESDPAITATVTEERTIQVQVAWHSEFLNRVRLVDESGTEMTFQLPSDYSLSHMDDAIKDENSYVSVDVRTFDDGNTYVYYNNLMLKRVE